MDEHPDSVKAHIGLVPQEFNFNIFEKVEDIVVDQAGYYGIPRAEARQRAEKVLTQLGLWDKREAKAMEISGGMKRRLLSRARSSMSQRYCFSTSRLQALTWSCAVACGITCAR
jgi:ABC-type multidrug transport system ATPase subunit